MRENGVAYAWAFDTVVNAINDLECLDARNLNEVVEGIKKDPELFIREVLESLQKEVEDRVDKGGLCPDCFGQPEMGRVTEMIDGHPLHYGVPYCPECEKEL